MIQTIITHECRQCGSRDLFRNGHDYKGSQKYGCKTCGKYGTLTVSEKHSEQTQQEVKRALLERVSLRGIARIFKVSRPTIIKWLKGWYENLPAHETTVVEAEDDDVLELDELWCFVSCKRNARWLWVALCRRTRQIVAYVIGDRSTTSCLHLWIKLPKAYRHCHSFSDFWNAYGKIFDRNRHQSVGKDSGQTNHIERWFNTLRQRLARFVRKTLSFSKSDVFHSMFLRLFIHHYNLACIS